MLLHIPSQEGNKERDATYIGGIALGREDTSAQQHITQSHTQRLVDVRRPVRRELLYLAFCYTLPEQPGNG